MSTLVISAVVAAALGAVPPSIGSEPVPANFDYIAAPAQQVALQAPNVAASLGSEPTFVDLDAGAPSVGKISTHAAGTSTLAASLGSEPFIVAFEQGTAPVTPAPAERRHDQRLACTCGRM